MDSSSLRRLQRWCTRPSAVDRAVRRCSTSPAWSSTSSSRTRQNQFRERSEYVPLYFSVAAALALAVVVCRCVTRVPALWRDVGHRRRLAGGRGRPGRRDPASRQPVLLRADDSQPDVRRAVRRAARLHRARAAADREPAGRRRHARVGAVGAAARARRLRRQLRLQPDRSRAERVLQSDRVGSGREQRARGRIPARAVSDPREPGVHPRLRGRPAGAGDRRRARVRPPRGRRSPPARCDAVRPHPHRRAADGAVAVSESRDPRVDRAVGPGGLPGKPRANTARTERVVAQF